MALNLYPKITNYGGVDTNNSEDVNALHENGRDLYMQNKFQEAIEWFDGGLSLKIDPNYIDALYDKGKNLYKQGKLQEAIEWFDKALEVNPNYVQGWREKVMPFVI